jgi:hypothetical protein
MGKKESEFDKVRKGIINQRGPSQAEREEARRRKEQAEEQVKRQKEHAERVRRAEERRRRNQA